MAHAYHSSALIRVPSGAVLLPSSSMIARHLEKFLALLSKKGSFSKDFLGMMSTLVDVDFDLGISAIPQVVSMAQAVLWWALIIKLGEQE